MKTHVDPNIFLTYRAKDIQTKMSSNPTCIEIDDEPEIALEKLDSHDFDQAPVVSDRTVIGWIVKRELRLDHRLLCSLIVVVKSFPSDSWLLQQMSLN